MNIKYKDNSIILRATDKKKNLLRNTLIGLPCPAIVMGHMNALLIHCPKSKNCSYFW